MELVGPFLLPRTAVLSNPSVAIGSLFKQLQTTRSAHEPERGDVAFCAEWPDCAYPELISAVDRSQAADQMRVLKKSR